MRFSGRLAYSEGRWSSEGPTAVPFLLLDVHESDIATLDYRAADASGGRFFLGYEPRIYFEEPDAAAPVDVAAEAEGFVRWIRETTGAQVAPAEVAALMAAPDGTPPDHERVEESVERLLTLADLPVPPWPENGDAPAG